MTKTDVRELALETLFAVMEQGEFSHVVLGSVLDKYAYLEKQERAFLTRLTEGTLERQLELDYILNQFSRVRVKKMKPVIRTLLRMSVYQLKYMTSVPDSAVCNEAVKLAKKKGFEGLSGFVNGILRNVARNLDAVEYPNGVEGLSVRYSMPLWIVEHFIQEYGETETEKLLAAFFQEQGTIIRVNTNRISTEELKARLIKGGVKTDTITGLPYALRIQKYDSLRRLKEFEEGLFYVQDISSMLAVEAALVQKDSTCLDVCAAPGGKALHLAEKLQETGHVEARDLTEYKLELMEENIAKSRCTNIHACIWDARVLDENRIEKADVLLADLPCSGLGVLGKKPDIKYRVSQEEITSLAELQREILSVVWQYVKPGGVLIYSTCTISREENQDNVRWFLKHFPFTLQPLPELFSDYTSSQEQKSGICQLLPGTHGTDGFFIARLVRSQ